MIMFILRIFLRIWIFLRIPKNNTILNNIQELDISIDICVEIEYLE